MKYFWLLCLLYIPRCEGYHLVFSYTTDIRVSCRDEQVNGFIFNEHIPLCTSRWSYYHTQVYENQKWCSKRNGDRIPYTLDKKCSFPYDCWGTREYCTHNEVRETTGRCDATCDEATQDNYQTQWICRKKCICARGMYRDKYWDCVPLDECPKPMCKKPKIYTSCASNCPGSCQFPWSWNCGGGCSEDVHCVCPPHLVEFGELCVKREDCPKCGSDMIITHCSRKCQQTCQGEPCDDNGCEDGVYCMCPPDKIRIDMKLPVRCVSRGQCPAKCDPPLVSKGCGTACPATCDDPIPNCTEQCVPENICVCPEGLVQRSATDKTCVTMAECLIRMLDCIAPAIPILCDSTCPKSCEATSPICTRTCKADFYCGCPEGFVQKTFDDGECVRPEQCPAKCDPPLVSKGCGTACPATCNDPMPNCTEQCVPENRCVCPEGLVQRSATDKTCVTLVECLSIKLGCVAPALPMLCNSTCPKTCEATSPACTRTCNFDFYCGCPEGYILKTLDGGECVRPEQCPPKCQEPKVYDECASICQPTCQLPNPASCRRGCSAQVCVCTNGKVELSDESPVCVDLSECPNCMLPGKPTKCNSTCPATCDALTPEPNCMRVCESDYVCECPPGYVHKSAEDHKCVKPEDCPAKCPAPKEFRRCPYKCQPTCQNQEPNLDECEAGCHEDTCVCPDGFVLLSEESGKCIKAFKCPECSGPSVPIKCSAACPESCEPQGILCVRECTSKYVCGCTKGYILKTKNSTECVKQEECPPICESPKRYQNCASLCQPTCQVPNPGTCRRECNPRKCICPLGMVQPSEDEYSCIFFSDCPKNCTAPKIFKKCPSKCQPTCENLNPNEDECAEGCREDECVCPPGMILLSNSSNECVKITKCPIRCTYPEVRANCRTTCEVRCDNLATLNADECNIECGGEYCVCTDGHVLKSASDRTCVPVMSCPPPSFIPATPDPPPQCESPKIYVECASKCPPTCETPDPAFCDESCSNNNCVCPPGMVHPKNGDDSCIMLSECPDTCQFPHVATDCASKCPPTCEDPLPDCAGSGCADSDVKCVCLNGFLQISAENNSCVLPTQCPGLRQNCGLRKIPTACASGCPATCDNLEIRFCAEPCRPNVKCECPRDMVQRSLEDDTCVWPYQCEI